MWWATEGRWWGSFLKSFNCQWIWFRKLVCGVLASLSVLHFHVAQTCSKGLPRSRKLMKKICDSEHFLRDSIQNRRKFNKFWTQLYQLIMIRRWGGQDGRTGPSIPFSMMAIHHVPLGQLVMTFWNSLGLLRRSGNAFWTQASVCLNLKRAAWGEVAKPREQASYAMRMQKKVTAMLMRLCICKRSRQWDE